MPPAGTVTKIVVVHGPLGLSEKRPCGEFEVRATAIGVVVGCGAPVLDSSPRLIACRRLAGDEGLRLRREGEDGSEPRA